MTRAIAYGLTAPLLAWGLAACSADPAAGDGGTGPSPLTQPPPLKQPLTVGAPVRTVVVRYEEREGLARRDTTCGVTALLFNTTANPTVTATTIDPAGCRLYVADPDADLRRQRWLCAGALNVSSGALMSTFGLCPTGTNVTFDTAFSMCGAIASSRTAAVSSMMEIAEDVVTDLNGTARFPAPVRMTAPNELGIGSWPANGPLEVRWTSADATSAMVTIEPETATATSPRIVCPAVLNGYVSVPATMIDQVGLRNITARLKVWSFRDGTTMAEGNNTYRISGAMVTNFTLQGRI
jgi:hypothetical protein